MIINKSQTYVLVSQTKDHYSAYEAYIDATSGTLYIQINRHKFFGVETTPTTLVRFNAIKTQMSESIEELDEKGNQLTDKKIESYIDALKNN